MRRWEVFAGRDCADLHPDWRQNYACPLLTCGISPAGRSDQAKLFTQNHAESRSFTGSSALDMPWTAQRERQHRQALRALGRRRHRQLLAALGVHPAALR